MADISLPQLGESVTEGTLGKWLKQVGDSVTKYEPLVEVVTDKVTAEVPSDYDGVLTEITVQEGETVTVGTVICKVAIEGEETGASGTAETAKGSPSAASAAEGAGATADSAPTRTEPSHAAQRGRYSPAVLRLAQDNGIDLDRVQGTGSGGRITRKDVRQYIDDMKNGKVQQASTAAQTSAQTETSGPSSASAETGTGAGAAANSATGATAGTGSTQPAARAAQASTPEAENQGDQIVEPSTVRKMIAKKMVESKHTAPHAWTVVEADVSKLVSLRQHIKADFKRKEGIDLTYLPFFIKAVAEALKQFPTFNAAWIDDKIHMRGHVNISIAVATDDALVVPVIHDADRQSIAGLAHSVNQLAAKARSGRLSVDDVQGGTFTVNNTGAFGSVLSQPIINMPQSGILSVESIVKKPVVVNDAIAIRSMVNLCLSLDHRLLDGWISGQFLKAVKDRLQMYDENTLIY